MSDRKSETDFKRGNKSSSSIMREDLTAEQVEQFMRTSFYLPVDVLKHRDWIVLPIKVITGAEFEEQYHTEDIYCLEDYELLCAAQWVAVSVRRRASIRNSYTRVAKIWYGKEPQS